MTITEQVQVEIRQRERERRALGRYQDAAGQHCDMCGSPPDVEGAWNYYLTFWRDAEVHPGCLADWGRDEMESREADKG